VPDDETGIGVEARERHVIVAAILQNGGIGAVAAHDRIEEEAVALIRYPLAFDPASLGRIWG
jgi:hypothetical protein